MTAREGTARRAGFRKRRRPEQRPPTIGPRGGAATLTDADLIYLARYLWVREGHEAVGLSFPEAYRFAADVLSETAAGDVTEWAMKASYWRLAKRWQDATVFPWLPAALEPSSEHVEAAVWRAGDRILEPGWDRAKRAASRRERAARELRKRREQRKK